MQNMHVLFAAIVVMGVGNAGAQTSACAENIGADEVGDLLLFQEFEKREARKDRAKSDRVAKARKEEERVLAKLRARLVAEQQSKRQWYHRPDISEEPLHLKLETPRLAKHNRGAYPFETVRLFGHCYLGACQVSTGLNEHEKAVVGRGNEHYEPVALLFRLER